MSKRARADLHARLAASALRRRATSCSATTASARCCCGASSARTTPPPPGWRRSASAPPRGAPPSARTRPRRSRCCSARSRSCPTTAVRGRCSPRSAPRCSRAASMAAAIRVLDAAIIDAPDMRWRTRAGVEREFARLEGETDAGTERALHVADAALRVLAARARRLRAVPRVGAARAGGLARRQRRARRGGLGPGRASSREEAEDERELSVILGWRATAAVLGPTPVDGRDRPLRDVPRARRREPGRGRAGWSTRWPRCTRCGATSPAPGAASRGQRGPARARGRGATSSPTTRRSCTCWRDGPTAPSSRCGAGLQQARGDRRPRAAGDDRRDARAGAVRAGALGEAGEQCALAADEAAADDIVTQVIWRGVRAKLLARAGPRGGRGARARRASRWSPRPTCSPIAPTRCSTSPRCNARTTSAYQDCRPSRSLAVRAKGQRRRCRAGAVAARPPVRGITGWRSAPTSRRSLRGVDDATARCCSSRARPRRREGSSRRCTSTSPSTLDPRPTTA